MAFDSNCSSSYLLHGGVGSEHASSSAACMPRQKQKRRGHHTCHSCLTPLGALPRFPRPLSSGSQRHDLRTYIFSGSVLNAQKLPRQKKPRFPVFVYSRKRQARGEARSCHGLTSCCFHRGPRTPSETVDRSRDRTETQRPQTAPPRLRLSLQLAHT
ncbi:hypothetical protein BDV95DRAFT_193680 [Massariosphaeria phaeospora]|uniref:Uncharacterized protein n=1 Tax=Massariosphaeria phaeospora TaxID=100035 RepID=A0A7C8I3I3_9PLEO|nr:hypothetical protein BDV95DRAFT_193680 [Massariosphaeria phaeospora]